MLCQQNKVKGEEVQGAEGIHSVCSFILSPCLLDCWRYCTLFFLFLGGKNDTDVTQIWMTIYLLSLLGAGPAHFIATAAVKLSYKTGSSSWLNISYEVLAKSVLLYLDMNSRSDKLILRARVPSVH